MVKLVDVNTFRRKGTEEYDCKDGGHFDAVSGCCGGRQHDHVEGMCASCNEFTSWVCSVCDADMDKQVYN